MESLIIKKSTLSTYSSYEKYIEENLIQTKNIKEIHIIKNYITSECLSEIINNSFSLESDKNQVVIINLTANNLIYLPNTLNQLMNLKCLILNNNKITEVNDSILDLKHLERLEMRSNLIKTISNLEKSQFFSIKTMTFSCNLIEKMDETLPLFSCLEEIGLFGNKLFDKEGTLNVIITKIPNLKRLYIDGNLFTNEVDSNDYFFLSNKLQFLRFVDGKII